MKIKSIITMSLLCVGSLSFAGEVPKFDVAKEVMKKCYSGLNVTVSVSAGLRADRVFNDFSDSGVTTIIGEQVSGNSTSRQDEEGEYESSYSSYDLLDSGKEMDSVYSRNRETNSGFVGFTMTVPLYSRDIRDKRREKRDDAVGEIADLYAKYDGYTATVQALRNEKTILRQTMMEEGASAIIQYYSLLTEIEKSDALRVAAGRKINMKLESCGYVEKHRTDRKR